MNSFARLATASQTPPSWLALPFAVLLAAIAVMPFVDHRWWERHYAKVSVVLGAVCALYYLFWLRNYERLLQAAHEYVSFLALVGSLFVVAGGIHVRVRGGATPLANCGILLLGATLANVVGTTGASMLLIRPYLRLNRERAAAFHVVFFIFVVSNVGGCLTPIGDPPLFVGYLKGVPFWWVLAHCWRAWLVAVGGLLTVFYVLDRRNLAATPPVLRAQAVHEEVWRLDGLRNFPLLAVVLGAVFIESPAGLREGLMLAAAASSYFLTPRRIHRANGFDFAPIREVFWLFIGIFTTMVPVLDYLSAHAASLGIDSPMKFFWMTGALSGVLDNAPTYLGFLAVALGNLGLAVDAPPHMAEFVAKEGGQLVAISLGAVFFGAMTYIGNGPNFMVRAIATHVGIKMPGFFAYILRYSLPVLVPFFFVLSLLFFSRWRMFGF